MNGNDIDERLKQYLLQRLESQNTSAMPNIPQQIAARDNIQSQALAGMAGSFAQMGTLYGKTPDAGPAIKSLTGTSQALQQGIDRMSQPKLDIDPRVLRFLSQNKSGGTQFKPLSNPLAGNKQGFYNPENPKEIIEGPQLYQKPDAPKEPKIDDASKAYASYQGKIDLKNMMMQRYDKAGGSVGPIGGRITQVKNALGYSAGDEADLLAADLMRMATRYIKETSGATVTPSEEQRLKASLPLAVQDRKLFENRLNSLVEEALQIATEKIRQKNPNYNPQPPSAAPSNPQRVDKSKYIDGKIYIQNGKKFRWSAATQDMIPVKD